MFQLRHLPLYCILAVGLLAACHADDESATGSYTLSGTVQVDSLTTLTTLRVVADSHNDLHCDTLPIVKGQFHYEGSTRGLDELYLCSDQGELCRLYVAAGMDVQLVIDGQDGAYHVDIASADTLNPWLVQQQQRLVDATPEQVRSLLDSLCRRQPDAPRSALLLRDAVAACGDSIFVRRVMGSLSESALPEWLRVSIETQLHATYEPLSRQRRLDRPTFLLADSTSYDVSASRSDYLLVFCWGACSPASLDSLEAVARRLSRDYEGRRLDFLTLCLQAPDSLWWHNHVDALPGHHALVSGGLADPRLRSWYVTAMPCLLLFDMYTNLVVIPADGGETFADGLAMALDRVPRRSTSSSSSLTPSRRHGR